MPTNGTLAVPFINLNFANWPLPIQCNFQINYNSLIGNGSASFTVHNNTDLSQKVWGPAPTSSSSTSSHPPTSTPAVAPSTVTLAAESTPTAPSTPTVTNSAGPTDLGAGTKAGIAIGCVVGASIGVALLSFAISQHRNHGRRQDSKEMQIDGTRADVIYDTVYSKPEMPSTNQPPQEMPLRRETGYSIGPYEVHGTETQEMP